MKANNILETIGSTPHLKINRLFGSDHEVWIKLERANPCGSIKDRIAKSMVEAAEKDGLLKEGTSIIEPTSGNTGIGLAMVCAVKKIPLTLVMPESMSIERRKIMKALGANLILTPKEEGMKGTIVKAQELIQESSDSIMLDQFKNPANIAVHRDETYKEIKDDFPNGIDYLITGVGTGGHISGCAERLKSDFSSCKVFAVEPEESPVISGGKSGPHKIQGIGAGFIPENYNPEFIDGQVLVTSEDAYKYAGLMAKEEGVLVGISSGATLAAIAKKLPEVPKGSVVLGFCYDTGERYMSIDAMYS